jgi:uncharacterized protein YqeY
VSDLQERLRRGLTDALRERDLTTARVLRTALSAIANAEAQSQASEPPRNLQSSGSIAGAATGVGASEVARRTLDEAEIRGILESERAECLVAATELEARGAHRQVDALRAQAALLSEYLDS